MAQAKLALVEQIKAEAGEVERRFRELLPKALAEKPRPADLAAFKAMLAEHGELKLWERLTGIMAAAEHYVLTATAMQEGVQVTWAYKLRQFRESLGYASAPELERALIRHAGICWARLALAEINLSATCADS